MVVGEGKKERKKVRKKKKKKNNNNKVTKTHIVGTFENSL
jgi:hypothetical protein